MRSHLMLGILVGGGLAMSISAANATCSGTPASGPELTNFVNDPAGWLKSQGNANLAAGMQSLAVAASADPSVNFMSGVQGVLKAAAGDQAKALGAGLGGLALTCSTQDAKFIAALAGAVAGAGNIVAADAYGEQSDPNRTASTGGAAGGGTGVGGSTSGLPSGGANTGGFDSSDGTPNTPSGLPGGSITSTGTLPLSGSTGSSVGSISISIN